MKVLRPDFVVQVWSSYLHSIKLGFLLPNQEKLLYYLFAFVVQFMEVVFPHNESIDDAQN